MTVPVYYPEDYGAIGDGVTPDHAAINTAIITAEAATPRGGIVHLLGPGAPHYTNETGPGLDDGNTIAHTGQIKCPVGYANHMLISTNKGDWTISGIRFLQANTVNGDYNIIRINDTQRINIDLCTMRVSENMDAVNRAAIKFQNSYGSEQINMTRCRIEGGGWYSTWTNAIRLQHCEFGGGRYGFYTENSSLVVLDACHFYEHSLNEVYMHWTGNISISNCNLEQAHQHGIYLIACSKAGIVNNQIPQSYIAKDADNTYDGILIDNDSHATRGNSQAITIVGNQIIDAQSIPQMRYGINILKTNVTRLQDHIAIGSNVILGAQADEIAIAAGATNARAVGNPGFTDV